MKKNKMLNKIKNFGGVPQKQKMSKGDKKKEKSEKKFTQYRESCILTFLTTFPKVKGN